MSDATRTPEELLREIERLGKRLAESEKGAPNQGRAQLRDQQRVLMQLASRPELHEADFETASREITAAAAECLSIERCSVWMYDQSRSSIRCTSLFQRTELKHSGGYELSSKEYPAYFKALRTERVIAAHDALRDPRTREFSDSYLAPLGIASMLDAPIRVGGRMLGVVCHEHVGAPRYWTEEEQSFAGSLGDLAALAVASDQRRKLELKVQHSQKLESLGILAGGIAHDFNNLLVGILGNAGLALDQVSSSNPLHEHLDDIRASAERAASLCRQLLAYSGRGKFVVGPIDLNALVREMGKLLDVSISKKTRLSFDLAEDLPALRADGTQLQQIVMNLITNASEATGDEGGHVSVKTFAAWCGRSELNACHLGEGLPEDTYVVLEVNDDGIGMDSESLQRIFDPFYTSKFTGRGLGLAAVLGIVKGHHGAIRIHSVPNRGTRFQVLLPGSSEQAQPPANEEPPLQEWSVTGTVLIVDDNPAVRSVGRRILERAGFEVLLAADGVEALETFRRSMGEIICVVLDLTMPVMNGEEVLGRLREISSAIPVVLTSGYSEQEAMDRFAARGRTVFLTKPFVHGDLLHALQMAVEAGGGIATCLESKREN